MITGRGTDSMIDLLLPIILVLLLQAYALPIALALVRGWVYLYTLGLPTKLKERRRLELCSDVWEQQNAQKDDGYANEAIALRLFIRVVLGVPSDLSWRLQHVDSTTRTEREPISEPVVPSVIAGPQTSANMSTREALAIFERLEMQPIETTHHIRGYFVVDGRRIFALHFSRGKRHLPPQATHIFRRALGLNVSDFARLRQGSMTRSEYVELMKMKGRI